MAKKQLIGSYLLLCRLVFQATDSRVQTPATAPHITYVFFCCFALLLFTFNLNIKYT
jgi:hypothetical protein